MRINPTDRPAAFWERVARRVCNLNGQDPDERVRIPSDGQAVAMSAPRWKKVAMEAKRLLILAQAYDEVEDEVDTELHEARFGAWLPAPASPPTIPDGYAIEVETREGSRYSPTILGLDWGGPEGYSIVAYRVEKEPSLLKE